MGIKEQLINPHITITENVKLSDCYFVLSQNSYHGKTLLGRATQEFILNCALLNSSSILAKLGQSIAMSTNKFPKHKKEEEE